MQKATGRSTPVTTKCAGGRDAIRAMMGILGADPLDARWESHDETSAALAAVDVLVQAQVQRREDARARRDWAEADAIRDRLKEAGIEVTDTADGPQWALLDGTRIGGISDGRSRRAFFHAALAV